MWYVRNSEDKTHRVGNPLANGFGLYDMSGNVWEWCADWYEVNYYKNSPRHCPKGAGSGVDRVVRGGSWDLDAVLCRSSGRGRGEPAGRVLGIGFRCAHDPK